jgi:hypothetical protein
MSRQACAHQLKHRRHWGTECSLVCLLRKQATHQSVNVQVSTFVKGADEYQNRQWSHIDV